MLLFSVTKSTALQAHMEAFSAVVVSIQILQMFLPSFSFTVTSGIVMNEIE